VAHVNQGDLQYETKELFDDRFNHIALGDLTGNGYTDIAIIANPFFRLRIYILENAGDLNFDLKEFEYSQYSTGRFIFIEDINRDGIADLVFSERSEIIAMLNDGDLNFELIELITIPEGGGSIRSFNFGDLTGNGVNDMITFKQNTSGPDYNAFWFRRLGTSNEFEKFTLDVASIGIFIAMLDFDKDGALDILTSSFITTILKNEYPQEESSTDDIFTHQISMYPNPSQDIITIDSDFDGIMYGDIFSIDGKRMLRAVIDDNTLNISALPSGMYVLKLTDLNGRGIGQGRIVKVE
jgi:hypothetical protein